MSGFSRAQAEALLAPARAGRPLYDELRPAYVSLDPLVALLRRRRFTGVILAAGGPGEGALWLEEGRLSSAWLFPPGAGDAAMPPDPLEVLRILWADADARVAVHAARPPAPGQVTLPAVPERQAPPTAEVPAPPPVQPTPEQSAPFLPPAPMVGAPAIRTLRRLVVPLRPPPRAQPRPPASPPAIDGPPPEERLHPALAAMVTAVPWSRLLPETLDRVRRHRGTPLAHRLEEAVNEALGSSASVVGREVVGLIDPKRATAALRVVADGVGAVAGAAFAERLLWTVARDFACEEAVKRLLLPAQTAGEAG